MTSELPSPGSLRYKMYTHDISTASICDLDENRYKIDNFYDAEEQKTLDQIYCWKGILRKNPDCKIGTVCDPHSFSGARTRFCLTWGCDPFEYVADDKGQPIDNERGGIIVYNNKQDCKGSLINQLKCLTGGLRQSADHILDPENRRSLIIQIVTLAAIVTIGLIFLTKFKQTKNKRIRKFRSAIDPRFAKTKPLFPTRLK